MRSQEFILIPKENYVEEQRKSSEVLFNPTISEKAKQLTLLQRQKSTVGKQDNSTFSKVPENQENSVEKRVLKSLSMLKPGRLEKTKPILTKSYGAPDVEVNEDGFLTVGDRATTIEATSFLYNLQQPKKRLHDPDYKRILERIDISPSLVANSDAKKILQRTRSKTIVRPKIKTPAEATTKQRLGDKQVAEDSQADEISTRAWETLRFREIKTREII